MKRLDKQFESALYRGFVRHRRFNPRPHAFRYRLFMPFIRLRELPALTRYLWCFGTGPWHWARFRRADYVGDPRVPLDAAVRDKLAQLTGQIPEQFAGEVYFFGHLRYLGFYFSPLNLYFIRQGDTLRYMLAEVSNTPWNERHYYALDLANLAAHDKAFHVSPFNPMSQRYHWLVRAPGPGQTKAMIHLEVDGRDRQSRVFDATLVMKRTELIRSRLLRVLLGSPMQTFGMVIGIYWQALRLFIKRVPIYPHPARQSGPSDLKNPNRPRDSNA